MSTRSVPEGDYLALTQFQHLNNDANRTFHHDVMMAFGQPLYMVAVRCLREVYAVGCIDKELSGENCISSLLGFL